MVIRRQFNLLPDDRNFLDEYGLPWETIVDGSQWVLIHNMTVPQGYNQGTVTAAIRLETGYPNTELNMVYFFPLLTRRDGKPIGATEVMQPLDGKNYQRWSRHRTAANPWKIGRDHIGTHVILIEDWLDREFEK